MTFLTLEIYYHPVFGNLDHLLVTINHPSPDTLLIPEWEDADRAHHIRQRSHTGICASWPITNGLRHWVSSIRDEYTFPGKTHSQAPASKKALRSLAETEAEPKKSQTPSYLSGKLRSMKKVQVCLQDQMGP